jgi:predicted transcriptional regulator
MTTEKQLHWRRSKVLELLAEGYSQVEIANTLQVTEPTISKDMAYLRQQSKDTIKQYTIKQLPLQFRVTIRSLQKAAQQYWNISQNAHDNEEKMQALECYIHCHERLCRCLWEGGNKLERYMIDNDSIVISDNDNIDKNHSHRLPHPGDMITPPHSSPWIYQGPQPEEET